MVQWSLTHIQRLLATSREYMPTIVDQSQHLRMATFSQAEYPTRESSKRRWLVPTRIRLSFLKRNRAVDLKIQNVPIEIDRPTRSETFKTTSDSPRTPISSLIVKPIPELFFDSDYNQSTHEMMIPRLAALSQFTTGCSWCLGSWRREEKLQRLPSLNGHLHRR